MNKDDDEDTPMLVLEFHEGEYLGPESAARGPIFRHVGRSRRSLGVLVREVRLACCN